ncbi:hypothetical protein F2Q69_00005374 [Brassica cretica]|uniref:Uncharacterized protein n=1 Tax=Brassica cretica TaxID=69181 RepID=A0A8S9P897_BRACR|nr:hypothetical protein F2Q69_00005374 [Brassica cretica]
MDSNQVRPDCIGFINLELLRSGKSMTSREVDNLDKCSHTSRGTINSPNITAFEDTPQKGEILTFHEHETVKLDMPHDVALVIALEVGGVALSKNFVDTGSSVNVISQETLWSLEQPAPKIRREATPLASFEGRTPLVTPDEGSSLSLSPMREVYVSNRRKDHTRKPETSSSLLHVRIPKNATEGGEYPTRTRPLGQRPRQRSIQYRPSGRKFP